jgi:hypothetical protein
LVQQAKHEREQLIEQILESQKAIDRSRHVLFRLDQALARAARLSQQRLPRFYWAPLLMAAAPAHYGRTDCVGHWLVARQNA